MNGNNSIRWHSYFDPNRFWGSAFVGLVGGIAGGLVAGIAARLAMRAIAVLSGQAGEFTLDGTLFIIGLGAILGMWLGLVFGLALPFLPGSIGRKGLLLGLCLSLLFAVLFFFSDPAGELVLAERGITAVLLASVPLIYCMIMGLVTARLVPRGRDLRLESIPFAHTAGLLTASIALVGVIVEVIFALAHPAFLRLGFNMVKFLDGLLGGALIFTIMIGIVGLMRSGAARSGPLWKISLGVSLLNVALLGLISVYEGINSIQLQGLIDLLARLKNNRDLIPLLAILLVGNLGLLLAGVAVLRSHRWRGWRAYTPLLLGLLPLLCIFILYPFFIPSLSSISASTRTQLGHWLGALFALGWVAFGLALWIETREQEPALPMLAES